MALDEDKQIAQAQNEAAKKTQKSDLLVYLVVVNRHTGKAEITEFPERALDVDKNC